MKSKCGIRFQVAFVGLFKGSIAIFKKVLFLMCLPVVALTQNLVPNYNFEDV
jgi:hypothetical protein